MPAAVVGRPTGMASVNPIQLQKFLKGIDYPAGKDKILSTAEGNDADDNVMEALRAIPDREYDGPNAVSHELSESGQT
jgi:hypothetical protein